MNIIKLNKIKELLNKNSTSLNTFIHSIVALLLALVCGGIIIAWAGFSPFESYKAIFIGSLGTKTGLVLSLSQATPLMFTGIAFAIAFRVKLINLGAEGQLHMGAIASAIVGVYVTTLSSFSHISVALIAGVLAGGLVGVFTGFLKIKFGAHEVITSLMLNEIIILFTSYLINGPIKSASNTFPQTERILRTAMLPKLVPRSQLTIAIIVVVVIAIMLSLLLKKTALGYEMQVTGFNLTSAKAAGINVSKIYLLTFFISGAVAGLCGSILVMGVNGRLIEGISAKFGFAGISVAALAAYSPVGAVFSALIFGILKAGAMTLHRTTPIPIEFVSVIQSLVLIFVAAPRIISAIFSVFKKKKVLKPTGKETDSWSAVEGGKK